MHIDRWKDLIETINLNFEVEEHVQEEMADVENGTIEYIVFQGPMGRIKLEFITKPKVLDKKVTYSNRIGSDVAVDYVYSQDEKVTQFLPYRWNEASESWAPLDVNDFNLG